MFLAESLSAISRVAGMAVSSQGQGENMNKTIRLAQECGPFCTERTHPKLPWLRSEIEKALQHKQSISFDRTNVKILTPSFIDEMLSELAIKFGIDAIQEFVTFNPSLEAFFLEQIGRGVRLRSKSQNR